MAKYTLDTDFSLLNGPKAHNWILRFRNMTDTAFAGKDNRSRLLGNLLIIEQYVNTLKKGLSADGKQISVVLQNALDFLWGYLDGHTAATDFQDFANNIYASTLAYNADEELTDAQTRFYQEYFGDGAARLTQLVVLVTPPFWFTRAITCAFIFMHSHHKIVLLIHGVEKRENAAVTCVLPQKQYAFV